MNPDENIHHPTANEKADGGRPRPQEANAGKGVRGGAKGFSPLSVLAMVPFAGQGRGGAIRVAMSAIRYPSLPLGMAFLLILAAVALGIPRPDRPCPRRGRRPDRQVPWRNRSL